MPILLVRDFLPTTVGTSLGVRELSASSVAAFLSDGAVPVPVAPAEVPLVEAMRVVWRVMPAERYGEVTVSGYHDSVVTFMVGGQHAPPILLHVRARDLIADPRLTAGKLMLLLS